MAEGYSATQLAQEFGLRSDSTFGHYLKRHGITPDLPNKRFSEEQAKTIRELRATRKKKKKADAAQISTPDDTPSDVTQPIIAAKAKERMEEGVRIENLGLKSIQGKSPDAELADELTQAATGAQEPLQASFETVDNASTTLVAPVVQPDVKNSSYREDEPQPITSDENHSAAPKDSENFSGQITHESFPLPKTDEGAATPKQQVEVAATGVPEQAETSAQKAVEESQQEPVEQISAEPPTDELSTALVDAQEPPQAKVAPVDDKTPVVAENPAEGEKKSPDTDTSERKEPLNNSDADCTTSGGFTQRIENLPAEILALPRFFPVKEDKHPRISEWQKPENQKAHRDVQGLKGFDICGHEQGVNYALIDFDHVLTDTGEFVNETAEDWYNSIQLTFKGYCERSISGHGLHILAKPTPEKFAAISGKAGVLHLDSNNPEIKIELFFKTTRYCLLTGDLYECAPNAPIAEGETADEVLQDLLNAIQKQLDAKTNTLPKSKHLRETSTDRQDEPEYVLFRAKRMLERIDTKA